MTKEELPEFKKECLEFYEKCEDFAKSFGWRPHSEWTRLEEPFFDFVQLIEYSGEDEDG